MPFFFFFVGGLYEDTIKRKDHLPPHPPPPSLSVKQKHRPPSDPISEENDETDEMYDDLMDVQPNAVPHRRDPDFGSIARDPSSYGSQSHQHIYLRPGEDESEDVRAIESSNPQAQYQVCFVFY